MNLTKQQRTILICIAVVLGSYAVRSIVDSYFQMQYQRRVIAMRVAQQRDRAAKAKVHANPVTTQQTPLEGMWIGQPIITSRGTCNMRVELKDKDGKSFSGFSTLQCSTESMNAFGTVFSGEMKNGSIELHVDKAIGLDSKGCSIASLTLTPFGANQLAAEWTQGKGCLGGHVILRKTNRPGDR